MTSQCPKHNPKLRKMVEDGTIMCYLNHVGLMVTGQPCTGEACCEDCAKLDGCPFACKILEQEKNARYIS